MKLRSRVAALAAAAGLAAGLLIVGGGGTADAQDTILIDCDRVAGTAAIKPALTNVAVPNTAISIKGPLTAGTDPFKPVATTRDCTGILATDDVAGPDNDGAGTPDDVGNLTKLAGKFVGDATCDLLADPPLGDPLDPLDGKLGLTFTALDPAGKPWASSTYVRVGRGENPLLPDEQVIRAGIVTKGAGVGADVYGSFLYAPYDAKTKPIVADQSFINGNSVIVPGAGSGVVGGGCLAGTLPLATVFLGTDGTGLLGVALDSSIGLSLPAAT